VLHGCPCRDNINAEQFSSLMGVPVAWLPAAAANTTVEFTL
jgi:hypothetical protein